MELSQLKVFFEVSEHLNFSKAAKKLHLSQPAVSIRIKSLEKSLNDMKSKGVKILSTSDR